jgi:pimeloyl-ACP methyl ester carboxylesterase
VAFLLVGLLLAIVSWPSLASAFSRPMRQPPISSQAGVQRQRLTTPTASSSSPAACEVAPGGVCGRVIVPLNRQEPKGAKIGIAYVRFPHTDTAHPALGTIFVTQGGPGFSAINNMQNAYLAMFGPLLEHRDLVLIDQRGVGRSRAIDCPTLQGGGKGDPYAAVASCGAQLGSRADLYGSAEVARDIDAVRAALGVSQFDFYGGSYAGVDIQAYAARFPGRLRSVVLDSSVLLSVEDGWNSAEPAQVVKAVELVCERSPLCRSANPDPVGELRWLVRRLRAEPVDGVGRDADGGTHRLHVTEAMLAALLQNEAGGLLVQGEIPAAARALRVGDSAPLLRLAAENDFPAFHGVTSDPTSLSLGDNFARFCTDGTFQWDKSGSPAQRRAQFEQAREALNPDRFAPFSLDAWVVPAPLGYLPDLCIGWPAPTHSPEPPVPAGTKAPGLPALVLTGDLDLSVPPAESTQLTGMFPQASVVSLAESGHHTAFSFQAPCSQALVVHFIDQLQAGDTSCARHVSLVLPAVASFPRRAASQEEAEGQATSEDGALRLHVARIAAATLIDALKRGFIQMQPPGVPHHGVGLRGGAFTIEESPTAATVHLTGARFAEDVSVTGDATVAEFLTLDASLTVTGAARGTLHVHGIWLDPAATRLTITGQLDGRRVNTSVPAA